MRCRWCVSFNSQTRQTQFHVAVRLRERASDDRTDVTQTVTCCAHLTVTRHSRPRVPVPRARRTNHVRNAEGSQLELRVFMTPGGRYVLEVSDTQSQRGFYLTAPAASKSRLFRLKPRNLSPNQTGNAERKTK